MRITLLLAVLLVLAGGQAGLRAQAKAEEAQGPDFKEVYDLIRAHLAGMSEGQLNRAAVSALVSGLAPRVSLVTNAAAEPVGTVNGATASIISRCSLSKSAVGSAAMAPRPMAPSAVYTYLTAFSFQLLGFSLASTLLAAA